MKFMKLPIRCLLAVVFAVGAMLVVRAQQSNGTKAAARISGIRSVQTNLRHHRLNLFDI